MIAFRRAFQREGECYVMLQCTWGRLPRYTSTLCLQCTTTMVIIGILPGRLVGAAAFGIGDEGVHPIVMVAAAMVAGPLSGGPMPPAQSASVWLWGLAPWSAWYRRLWGLVAWWVLSAASEMK